MRFCLGGQHCPEYRRSICHTVPEGMRLECSPDQLGLLFKTIDHECTINRFWT